jgi:hypothetical protein
MNKRCFIVCNPKSKKEKRQTETCKGTPRVIG